MKINNLWASLGLAGVVASVLAGAAWAQETSEDVAAQTTSSGQEFDLAMLDSFTIYATTSEAAAFDLPTSVTVIDREEIEDLNTGTISDLFRMTPGVQFQGGPRRTGDVPSIRGIGGSGVQIFLDGARQSYASGHDGRFFVDPELLQAVEVVRGPSSALYGSGSLGGVIGFRTVDAADFVDEGSFGLRVRGGYESVNEQWSETATGFYLSQDGNFDFVGSLTARQSSDIALANGTDLPSDDDILSSLIKGSFNISEDLSFEASWMRYHNDAREPNNGQDVTATDEVDKDVLSQTFQGSVYFNPDSDLFDFEFTAYRSEHGVEEAETTTTRVVNREVESWGVRALNRSTFGLGADNTVRFTYGGEYYVDEQTGTDNTTVDGTRGGVPNAEATYQGLFAQAEFDFQSPLGAPGQLLIIPGIRWDSFENVAAGNPDTDDNETSMKLGASYLPNDWFMVFGSYAEAFRAPSFDETYADGVHFPIPVLVAPGVVFNSFIANPNLRPESSETWEFGAGLDFDDVATAGDHFRIRGSYWTADVTDLIDLSVNVVLSDACYGAPTPPFPPCTDAGTSQYVNTHNAELDGVEIEAEYTSNTFYATASFSSIDGTDQNTGAYVGVLFPDRVNLDAGIHVPNVEGARIGARAEFAADFDEVNAASEMRDGYAVFDLYAVFEPQSGPLQGFRLDLGIDNVADEDYERVFAGTSEPGRNFKVGLGWRMTF